MAILAAGSVLSGVFMSIASHNIIIKNLFYEQTTTTRHYQEKLKNRRNICTVISGGQSYVMY